MQVVWFKRDLRVHDHQALAQAAEQGPLIPLYIVEPELWAQPDLSARHFKFLSESVAELDAELRALGQPLVIRVGDVLEVLTQLHAEQPITRLWSHQETWNDWTYRRDLAVKAWAASRAIDWHEPAQNGVVRCLKNRNGWAARWQKSMRQPVWPTPKRLTPVECASEVWPTAHALSLHALGETKIQRGGRSDGLRLLGTFLHERGQEYTVEMSSPVTAFESCSRLSAHLAFGTVSMREALHHGEARAAELKKLPREDRGNWPRALRSFLGRLRWHCHFMQKLEDEPRIEFENMHSAYNGLRETEFNSDYFEAWKTGQTGFPMIDACMRALIATGWLNFRMRAMLMSFAAYHLWLHWREPALHLARLFTDYEPGIHFSQAQMQSGTTGINSIRIYNPVKQSVDQDPKGEFIRRWIPELTDMPDQFIHTPWQVPSLLNGYPMPIVDEKQARKGAADRLYGLRKNDQHREQAKHIVNKHGSRKSGLPNAEKRPKTVRSRASRKKPADPNQMELDL